MSDLEVDYLAAVLRDIRGDPVRKESDAKGGTLATSGQNEDNSVFPNSKERLGPSSSPSMTRKGGEYDQGDDINTASAFSLQEGDLREREEQGKLPGDPPPNLNRAVGANYTTQTHAPLSEASTSAHSRQSLSDPLRANDGHRSRLGLHVPPKSIESQLVAQETPRRLPFRPKRTFPVDTLLYEFMRHALALVEAGKFREAARKPAGVHSTGEWIRINAFLYYNKANEFFGLLREKCTCDKMSIGRKYEYMWADGKSIRKPINIPAVDYVEYVMEWVEANFSDAKLFPLYDDAGSGHGFTTAIKDIFKRLFRVFGHMESLHREDLEAQEPGAAAELESTFHCFVEFVKTLKLMDKKGLAPIRSLQNKWKGMEG